MTLRAIHIYTKAVVLHHLRIYCVMSKLVCEYRSYQEYLKERNVQHDHSPL